ncbi:MAG: hypothetical protein RMN52_09520 [Anaerolineae bacterium]|nr:hypothetical protein [Candidatus Roseilinea sp.]MDW8450232.1 hypothetical protein [Anaerolineae bacterium]
MNDLERYRTDRLILLVGGNPLPNYVAARLLGKQRITLLHSNGTQAVANRLKQQIEAVLPGCGVDLCVVDEASAPSIYNGVHKLLNDEYKSVGLHYTGGTKAMAVHAYRAVADWAQKNKERFTASYLDARNQELVIDDERSPVRLPVGDALNLTLQEMLNLHGWKLKQQPRQQPILPKAARAIACSYAADCKQGVKSTYQEQWKQTVLYCTCRKNGSERWLSAGQLKQARLNWPAGGSLDAVAEALKVELNQTGEQLDIGAAYRHLGLSEPEDFCKWLDGLWLEHYVLDVLNNLSQPGTTPNPSQVFQGVNVTTAGVELDLDVAALLGYQLFAFSCGTADGKGAKAQLKHKLFEVVLRARQLGGDQARVALVSVYTDPAGLQAEARQQIDPDNQAQIRVFGCAHLADLAAHIEQWIADQRPST